MKKILTIILLLISITGFAQTKYYIKNGGNDDLDGLSDANAWATIGKVRTWGLSGYYNPGDTVAFRCGDLWEEDLVISEGGGEGAPIIFTSYGTGARPIITGRDDISGWDNPANWSPSGTTDVWYMTLDYGSASRPRVWLDEVEVKSASSAALVTNLLPYYHDQATTRLYVYSPDPATPATNYTRIERSGVRNTAVDIVSKDNITLSNLDLRGALYCVRVVIAQNITIEDCNIGLDAGRYGVYIQYQSGGPYTESSNGILRRCTIDSGLRFFYDWVYGDPYFNIDGVLIRCADNWEIYGNEVIDWNHCQMVLESYTTTTEVLLSNIMVYNNILTCPSLSYGHGFGADIRKDRGVNNKVFKNLIYDCPTRIQLNGYGLDFSYNIINIVRGTASHPDNVGQGIYLSGYATGGHPQYQRICNNIIANCDDEGLQIYDWEGSGYFAKKGNEISNNIFLNNDNDDDYQLSIASHDSIYSNTFKNNMVFKTGITDLINYMGTPMTVTEFNSEDGTNGDIIKDNTSEEPIFITDTFKPQITSPVINAGIDLRSTSDYAGNPIIGQVDIGPYEYQFPALPSSGLGWDPTLYKNNIKDTVNIAKSLRIKGVPITATATEINNLDGSTGVTGSGNVVLNSDPTFNSSITLAGDTTVAPVIGKIVYQAADSSFYGCRSTVAPKKWYKLNE